MKLDEILKKNPHINKEMLKEAMDLMRNLQESGVVGTGYNLISPYAHRRKVINKDTECDPRTIHLSRKIKA